MNLLLARVLLLLLPLSLLAVDYLDNHSCKECHEAIYEEFSHSAHAMSYFTDTLHRKVAQAAEPHSYSCAPCHMPTATNRSDLISGRAQPNPRDKRQREGVSCFFCHTIAYVKKAHRYNINLPARQAKGYKPSLFGSLFDPDESDKHSSLKSPIYMDNVCMGCHSHKVNENNVTVFRAMGTGDTSRGCVRCHMPKVPGGVEKMDKRGRGEHRLHTFPGIRDEVFRKTGYALELKRTKDGIAVTLINKMPHPMIIQPAREKYLHIVLRRKRSVIWENFRQSPKEDPQTLFVTRFYRDGKPVAFPNHATAVKANNLKGKERRTFRYKIPGLRRGDEVEATLYALLAKPECRKAAGVDAKPWTTPMKILSVRQTIP